MLKDTAKRYYFDQNFNCAETVLHAANEYYNLGLDEQGMKTVAVFGAGIQTGNLCGAVLGGCAALSMKYVEVKAHESDEIKPVTTLFLEKTKEAFEGTHVCEIIKPKLFKDGCRCWDTVAIACDVLEKTIEEYEASKNN